jgi:hypothetical protein
LRFEDLKSEITQYADRLRQLHETTGAPEAALCRGALLEIGGKVRDYDALTTISRDNRGERIGEVLRDNDMSLNGLRALAFGLAQCVREYSLKSEFVPKEGANALIRYFDPSNPSLDEEGRQYADYVTHGLPRDIIHEMINNHRTQQVVHEQKIKSWEESLQAWDKRVASHEGTMKNLHLRYNFVELSKAFWEMYKNKEREKDRLLWVVIGLGLFLLMPIVAQFPLADSVPYLSGLKVSWTLEQWPKVVPLITLEMVNLYFFRIFLHNFYSAKAQLLQLDLRQALCAFVESYVDFVKEKLPSQKDVNPLAKFEALVFSGLTPDPDKVPSSFDGLEQLMKMAKEFKKAN